MSACATKRDVRDLRVELRDQMAVMRTQQDSILQLLTLQRQAILDSLVQTTDRLLQVRGSLSHELSQLQDQLQQLQALTGQVQAQLSQVQQNMAQRVGQNQGGQTQAPGVVGGPTTPATAQGAQQFYDIGIEQRNRGNLDTARRAFQAVVDSFPKDSLAPEAERQIAETYYLENHYDQALSTLDTLVSRWDSSPQAAEALYRAGMIAKERGNNQRAREYFNKLVAAYPQSDAAGLAQKELRRPGG